MAVSNNQFSPEEKRIFVGISGASGSIYGQRLVEVLLPLVERIYLVFTESGEKVVEYELGSDKESILRRAMKSALSNDEKKVIRIFKNSDLFAPIASGSSAATAMVIVPSSMGTLARIAQGVSSNLVERAADVMLKQRRKLIICPRETPFNLIQVRNMSALLEAGGEILPLMPGFYQKPETIEDLVDFCVGKILEQLHVSHKLYPAWNSRLR